ncbi:type III-A CRISPR-associated protein Csm2 [Synechococcus sp. PCC 7336]|uniref:type III-A CRISPR-associated protein Csm2 n=1 Tax=Synechococcus sp. PCC 7336 TaxID=195250 RepID=UPI00034D1552|nr:type III-A CRISPR-associated protein Csm2 [Synechococcus sp. PCC 7336]
MSRPNKPVHKSSGKGQHDRHQPSDRNPSDRIDRQMIATIQGLEDGLHTYNIRTLVEHAATFGPYLRNQPLETNQIRKFLDAINRLKAQLTGGETGAGNARDDAALFANIETDIVLLKPKLAYAAARQKAAKPLSDVMSAAIDKVRSLEDFERLVQLIESTIAYHKAEGGK